MTIRIPERTMGDKVLHILGKKRAVFVPGDIYKKHGPYVYARAQRESFLKALLRKKDGELPDGWVYVDHK